MKRLMVIMMGLLLMQVIAVAQPNEMPIRMKKYGWAVEGRFWSKTVYPNLAEKNRGKGIRKNAVGLNTIQMAYQPESGLVLLFVDYSVSPLQVKGRAKCIRSGVYFKTQRLENVKYDDLGRVVEHRECYYGYDETYEADGLVYKYEYYGDSDVLKRLHYKGWKDYPKDAVIRERKFPETKGCVPYEHDMEFVYDTTVHTITTHWIKTTLGGENLYPTRVFKGEFNWSLMASSAVVSYDCNGNPFEVKLANGKVWQVYYEYE